MKTSPIIIYNLIGYLHTVKQVQDNFHLDKESWYEALEDLSRPQINFLKALSYNKKDELVEVLHDQFLSQEFYKLN